MDVDAIMNWEKENRPTVEETYDLYHNDQVLHFVRSAVALLMTEIDHDDRERLLTLLQCAADKFYARGEEAWDPADYNRSRGAHFDDLGYALERIAGLCKDRGTACQWTERDVRFVNERLTNLRNSLDRVKKIAIAEAECELSCEEDDPEDESEDEITQLTPDADEASQIDPRMSVKVDTNMDAAKPIVEQTYEMYYNAQILDFVRSAVALLITPIDQCDRTELLAMMQDTSRDLYDRGDRLRNNFDDGRAANFIVQGYDVQRITSLCKDRGTTSDWTEEDILHVNHHLTHLRSSLDAIAEAERTAEAECELYYEEDDSEDKSEGEPAQPTPDADDASQIGGPEDTPESNVIKDQAVLVEYQKEENTGKALDQRPVRKPTIWFRRAQRLETRRQLLHLIQRDHPYKIECKECSALFSDYKTLEVHLSSHNMRPGVKDEDFEAWEAYLVQAEKGLNVKEAELKERVQREVAKEAELLEKEASLEQKEKELAVASSTRDREESRTALLQEFNVNAGRLAGHRDPITAMQKSIGSLAVEIARLNGESDRLKERNKEIEDELVRVPRS